LTAPPGRWSDGLIAGSRWVIAVSLVVALVLPSQAAGHATLLSSAPAAETVVEGGPSRIVLRFSEPVTVVPGDIKVFDGLAKRVAIGKVERPRQTEVVVPIAGELERGSYTVVWRVISADLDSINDFFVFHVGAAREAAAAGAPSAAADDGPGAAALAIPAVVLLGAAAAGIAVRRRPRLRLVPAIAGVAAVAALAVVAVGGGESTGASPGGGEPFRADVEMGTLAATVSVAPAQIGANRVELTLPPPGGAEGGYFEVRVVATLPSAGLGPLRFTGIQGTDPGQFAVRQANLPLPGDWQLRVSARRGLKDRYSATVALPIKTAQ
jgi:methionine-rich copper-binding protein CopC